MSSFSAKIEQLRNILVESLPCENLPSFSVKGDAPQSNSQPQQSMSDRPPSARSNRDERLKLLKEKQNEERLKKLEELKKHAILAARLREEQDTRRKKHFEQLGKKEDDRRRQAEERRRILDDERKLSLQSKFDTKKTQVPKPNDRKPFFAFGSCTPRLIENNVDGFHWKSQYNLNVTRESTMKSTSAHDLHSQTMEPDRVFCGRRKTDLTPTLPIRRIDCSTRSTSRAGTGAGRVYSSMTRLDKSLGGQARINNSSAPFISKSTTQLASAGKLTRTEILRLALVSSRGSGRESTIGIHSGSVTPSRPPSSMSSLMTSSTHSQAPIRRPRNLGARTSRPVSVHITGVSNGLESALQHRTEKSNFQPPSTKNEDQVLVKAEKSRNPNQNSGAPISTAEIPGSVQSSKTLTLNRNLDKKMEVKLEPIKMATMASLKAGLAPKKEDKSLTNTSTIRRAKSAAEKSTTTSTINEVSLKNKVTIVDLEKKTEYIEVESIPSKLLSGFEPPVLEIAGVDVNSGILSIVDIAESVFGNSSEASMIKLDVEEFVESRTNTVKLEVVHESEIKSEEQKNIDIELDLIQTEIINEGRLEECPPVSEVEENSEMSNEEQYTMCAVGDSIDSKAPKIMTEEEAKTALAEKRRLAREVQEREAARLEEERLLEEERQRLEIEEAERLAFDAREQEEERLRIAIEEQEKREQDEKKKMEEEETVRLEREIYEREAAREAERVRLEMEERLKREEEERLERKRRVEAIMSRTRKKETESAMVTTPTPEETASNDVKSTTLNGIQTTLDQSSTHTTMNNINNFNNNNDFSETLIDFGDMIQSPPSSTQSNNSSNDIMNSPLHGKTSPEFFCI